MTQEMAQSAMMIFANTKERPTPWVSAFLVSDFLANTSNKQYPI
jgi:hypothetical protein